jgi:ABC-type branched-subunit amino acid transport system ATPase component
MDVTIPGVPDAVSGTSSIVIIGPNGVGKTRLGVAITSRNGGERVSALRNVEIPEIPALRFDQAAQQVKNALNELMHAHWRQSFELQNLMSEILAEDRELAVEYRRQREKSPTQEIPEHLTDTRLGKIVRIWNRHFPGRIINIDYAPKVERTKSDGSVVSYPISQMSEGERTALYLAARIVSCDKPLMLVDEPETFFHPLLARNLWNDLEEIAPKIRFVYITHDIPFALSRRGAVFAVARSEDGAELLPQTSKIPSDVIAEVLGAASFSISASRLIFCEGEPSSLDAPILSAWHDCKETAVVAVGSCNSVRECVAVFNAKQVTSGVTAFGYVDRDGWPDAHLNSDPNVKPHPVSEVEGLFCLEAVFKALAVYNGSNDAEADARFSDFLADSRRIFNGVNFNKELLNRGKARIEIEQKSLFNPIKPNPDLQTMEAAFVGAQPAGGWPIYLATVFTQEQTRLTNSLHGGAAHFVRDYPAKSYFSIAAKHLQFVPEKMVETLCKALKLKDDIAESEKKLKALRDSIVLALTPHLWPRTV